jgi:hypothetical protein
MITTADIKCANVSGMADDTISIINEHGTSTYLIIDKGSMWMAEVIMYHSVKQRGKATPFYADTREELITYITDHANRDPKSGRKINLNFHL